MQNMETSLSFVKEIPLFARLEKIAAYSALTPKEQMQYDDSYNNYVSYRGQLDYRFNKGRAEGIAEGIKKKEHEMITAMLLNGLPCEIIANISKLSIEEIKKIQSELS